MQVFWCRRSLCSPQCLLSRCTRAYYSQPASIAGRVQDPGTSISAAPSERARTAIQNGSRHPATEIKDPRETTPFDRYLAFIKATDLGPTLDDVEQCKPESFSRPDSSRYAAEYTSLLETLCRSFSKNQLRRFTELYKLDPIWTRSSRRKTEYAESIIEKAWGWPSLKEMERKRRDATEVLVKSFTVTPSQLFLLMGKDGANLLQLSMQYNIHISLTSSPLALRVEGLRGSLKRVTEYISSFKKGIIDKILELPSGRPIRPDLLQRMSRLSGAYVENQGNRGKVRICAENLDDITAAERLALRASLVGARDRTVCYDPPVKSRDSPIEISEQRRYAVYPFAAPSTFPWTMHSGGAFRLRRIADWLGVDSCEDIASTGGLTNNINRLLNLDEGDAVGLSQLVCSTTPDNISYRQRTVTASLGHILISSGDNLRDSVLPPLSGALSLPEALEWVKTSGTLLTFVPSTPSTMMTVTVDKQRIFHRLIYRTLPQITDHTSNSPQHVLKFEMELSCPSSTSAEEAQPLEYAPQLEDVLLLDEPKSSADPYLSQTSSSHSSSLSEVLGNKREPSCQAGDEVYVNLMLPDRPMDIQFCVFTWNTVTSMQQPQVLREYADKLHDSLTMSVPRSSQPNPPAALRYKGREYYLYDILNSKQSNDSNTLSSISSGCYPGDVVEVSQENTTDLQSTQKRGLCQVKLSGATGGPSWERFLEACDQLSVMSSESKDKSQLVYPEE